MNSRNPPVSSPEMVVRRRAARALRLLGYALIVTDWLAFFGTLVLFLAGKYDESRLAIAILDPAATVIEARLLEEFADLIERREWP